MAESSGGGYPREYRFSMARPSVGAVFTRSGRVRRRLWRAHRSPDDASSESSLVDALAGLRTGRKRGKEAVEETIRQSLLHLAWSKIEAGAIEEACTWLGELDGEFPDLPERLSLRWQLMGCLLSAGADEAYVAQARLLLADPLLSPQTHASAILGAMRTAYERISPPACGSVVAAAHGQLARGRQLQAAAALCRCPQGFTSAKDARSWAEQVDSAHLSFSRAMRADALVIAAQADEWAGDWDVMEAHACEALVVSEGHVSGTYWLVRARLHRPSARAAEGVDLAAAPDEPRFDRLRLEVELHRHPALSSAAAALEVLAGALGPPDALETRLTVELLAAALTLGPAPAPDQTARCADICRRLESWVGRLPWAEVSIATAEIQVERRYVEAAGRLEAKDVARIRPAGELFRVARILAGSPAQRRASKRPAGIDVIEHAMYRLFGRGSTEGAPGDAELWQGLAEARQDPMVRWLGELADAAEVLGLALRAVCGDEGARGEVLACRPGPTSPPWVRWLLTRTRLLTCDASNAQPSLDGLDLAEFTTAWEVAGWRCNYARAFSLPDGAAEQVRLAVEEGLRALGGPARLHVIDAGRSQAYRPPWKPQGGGVESLPGFGKLCGGCLRDEGLLELEYGKARLELASGRGGAAVKTFRRLRKKLPEARAVTQAFWAPLIEYWSGVASAHEGEKRTAQALKALLGGPKDPEARGQLAMLAIRDGDLDAASRRLDGAGDDVPGVLYARALLAARRGDGDAACGLLDTPRARAVLGASLASPYARACWRLVAAVRERQGRTDEAERLHREDLRADPRNKVTSARLSRLLIRRHYDPAEPTAAGLTAADAEFLDRATKLPWGSRYALFYSLLTTPAGGLDDLAGSLKERFASQAGGAWRQAMARRLLQARRAGDALSLLGGEATSQSPAFLRRTGLILRTWNALTRPLRPFRKPTQDVIENRAMELWAQQGKPEGRDQEMRAAAEAALTDEAMRGCVTAKHLAEMSRCREDLEQLAGPRDDDAVLARWLDVARCAVEMGENPAAGLPVEAIAAIRGRDGWLFPRVVELWSPQPQRRKAAAEAVLSALADGGGWWGDAQRAILGAVGAWAAERANDFLACYEQLHPNLPDGPLDPRHLWLAAGRMWFRQEQWDKLIGEDLPACVEDLSHPEARLLVGLAYARTAAATKDLRDMATMVRRGREMLRPIVTST